MNPLLIAQYMAASAFLSVAVLHALVWLKRRDTATHLCFAITAAAAGANAVAEALMYGATDVATMAPALKWYVATSGIWIVALVWFIVSYTRLGRIGWAFATVISIVFVGALSINYFSSASFLYTEINSLRKVPLPWGDSIWLAEGQDNPWRFVTEVALLGVFGLVIAGWFSLRRLGQPTRAWLFGGSVIAFLIFFATHAFLVDTGKLNSPYLSSYAFLAVAFVMSFGLASDVVRSAELSAELRQKDLELQTAIVDERHRIAGDLHDSVTQTLFSTAAIAGALPDVWERHPDDARRGLIELRQLTKGALAEMRSLLVELRPAALTGKTFDDLLKQLADATAGRSTINMTVDITIDYDPNDVVKIALYRIAQESLNNVARHAETTEVNVRLHRSGNSTILSIRDDGRGFDATDRKPDHLGLDIMEERARAIGAELMIDSTVGQGTTVTVRCAKHSGGGDDE